MTDAEKADLARQLAELQATASQASGAAATALRDAAQSLAQGDTAGARSALDRLGEAITGAERPGRDEPRPAGAASRLQDARRDLADAGRRTTAEGAARPGSRAGSGSRARAGPGRRPEPGRGSGPGSRARQGKAKVKGRAKVKVRARVKVKVRVKVRAKVRVRAKGKVRARAAVGGGGSNARSLGNGTGGNGQPAGPTNPNRPSELGEDLSSVFAPFDRLGTPRRPVVHRRDRRRRPDPAGQPGRVRLEQRLADALRGRVRRLLPLRPDLARARLRAAVGEGPGPRLLQLTRSIQVTAGRPARTQEAT